MHKELDVTILQPHEWSNSGSSLVRNGIGIHSQAVEQRLYLAVGNSYTITESYINAQRFTTVYPSEGDEFSRGVLVYFISPLTNSATQVGYDPYDRKMTITNEKHVGPIERLSMGGIGFASKLAYGFQGLERATLQGEFVPGIDMSLQNSLSWEQAVIAMVSMAQTESQESLEVDKRDARNEVEKTVAEHFGPLSPTVIAASAYANRAYQLVLSKFPDYSESLEKLPLREKILDSALRMASVLVDMGDDVEETLPRRDVEEELKIVTNTVVDMLSIYSRQTSRRILEVDRFGEVDFAWKDIEIIGGYEIVFGYDYQAKKEQKHRMWKDIEIVRAEGVHAYGEPVDILKHRFVIARSDSFIIQCLSVGQEIWAIRNIPQQLPIEEIKSLMDDITADFRPIRDLMQLEAVFT